MSNITKFLSIKMASAIILVSLLLPSAPILAKQLPTEAFASLPDVTQVKLSPDGKHVASLVRYEHSGTRGVVLHVVNLDTSEKKILTSTDNEKFLIGWIDWANNDEILTAIYYPSKIYRTPVTRTQLMKFSIKDGKAQGVIPSKVYKDAEFVPVRQDNVIDMLPDSPDELLISLRTTNAVTTNVMRINHKKQRARIVHRPRGHTLDWITDRQHNVRIAYRFDNTTVSYDYRQPGERKWRPLFNYEAFSEESATPLGFDEDPNILYFSAYHEGRDAVFKLNLAEPEAKQELVFSDPDYDVNGKLVYSEKAKKVVGIQHEASDSYYFWDKEYQRIARSIDRALPDTHNQIIDFSRDEKRFLIFASSDNDPGHYLLWDRERKIMEVIAPRYSALSQAVMAEKEYIDYQARDGLTINGYLTKPHNFTDKPVPTIIFPHGGPISHDGKSFDYWTQFFANRGYAVLQMNFRGSSGYGYDFMKSGLQDWGGKMQTDVEDGTRWLIEQGVADPERICIVGASYGGYAALMEASSPNKLYQCAVSFAGVTDLPLLISNSRNYINHKVVKEMIGSNRKKLKQRSPVNLAEQIEIPVLLVHGDKDLVVPVAHGRKMRRQLERKNKQVEYIEFDGGNHFLSNEEHRLSFFAAMQRFLDQHLSK